MKSPPSYEFVSSDDRLSLKIENSYNVTIIINASGAIINENSYLLIENTIKAISLNYLGF